MNTSYTALEPSFTQQLGLTEGLTFVAGQATSLFASVSFVWTLGILICVAATGFVWIRGGLFRMEASEAGIRKSNEEFTRGSFGLLGVLLLFLIIYTINKGLLLGDVGLDKLGQVGAVQSSGQTGQVVVTQPNTTNLPSGADNLSALNAAGILINRNNVPCTQAQMQSAAPPCTSLEGLPRQTVDMLINLKQSSGCAVVVTGGTEPGHQTHGIGKYPVDLQKNACLDSFVRVQTTIRAGYHGWGGYIFYDESSGATSNTTGAHFHVYK